MSPYNFSNNWFDGSARPIWDRLLPSLVPKKVLEIGSFEGASACYLIDHVNLQNSLELHCIDTWEGGIEHQSDGNCPTQMGVVEARFTQNLALARQSSSRSVSLHVHKGYSDQKLLELLANGHANSFDFVYIDGSHQAPDVLTDAVLAFKLVRVGGMIGFDGYIWSENLQSGVDPLKCPKLAIGAFTNIFIRKLRLLPMPASQFYMLKTAR